MYNAKNPALPTTVGLQARIILKLQPVVGLLVKRDADFDWIGGNIRLLIIDRRAMVTWAQVPDTTMMRCLTSP
jgi:hypothetical protein